MSVPLKQLLRAELSSLKAYRVPAKPPPVKLDANESPWPLPQAARDRFAEATQRIAFHRYPDGRAAACRGALARRDGGDPEAYVLGSGSDELIGLLATALCRPRKGNDKPVALYPEPTFVMYGVTSRAHGWETVGVPLDVNWQLDEDAMRAAIDRARPNIVYYASPNNPTGNVFRPATIEALTKQFPDTLHVIDEAYVAFAQRSLADWCGRFSNLAVMGTLSKVGLAAIRFGWVRMHPALAEEIEKVRQPFNLNALTQELATLALTELAPVFDAQVEHVVNERGRLAGALAALPGCQVYPSEANFVLVKVDHDVTSLSERLLQSGIAVRRFSSARLQGHVRITVGTPEENDQLLLSLQHNLRP